MQVWYWHRARFDRRRRVVSIIALAAYLIAAVGVPLPVYADKHDDVPFPCQHHACGCATAAQCWDHCCCFSPQQRLDWAQRHHVVLPARFLAAVMSAQSHDETCHAHEAKKSSCCSQPAPGQKCCDHDSADPHDRADYHDDDESASFTLVMGDMARTCQGLSNLWCTTGAVLPAGALLSWQFQWNVVDWLSCRDALLDSCEAQPPVLPPRV